ncbi:hypothetical protein LTR40_012251, partial [Exophiala xenobiotica]
WPRVAAALRGQRNSMRSKMSRYFVKIKSILSSTLIHNVLQSKPVSKRPKKLNTTCNKPSKHQKLQKQMQKLKMHTSPLHLPLPVIFSMMSSTQKGFNSPPRTSVPLQQSKTIPEWHIAWTRMMSS